MLILMYLYPLLSSIFSLSNKDLQNYHFFAIYRYQPRGFFQRMPIVMGIFVHRYYNPKEMFRNDKKLKP